MAIFDLFSKRQKTLLGEVPDVYTYDKISNALRVQIVHIWRDALGNEQDYYNYRAGPQEAYKFIVDTICREYGIFKLPTAEKFNDRMYLTELANYLLQEEDVEKQLDVIELSFKVVENFTREYQYLRRQSADKYADNAITELNNRFKEHGIGFQFVENEIIRIDSELIHTEAVKPALRLLNE